jgi:ABC-type branched-subunit amino acid transport system substrate-binding protein
MIEAKNFKKPCIMYQDDEYGKNVLDGFTQQLTAMKVTPASVTSFKRGASDFSAQVAKMKSDGCDMVLLGAVIREPIGAMSEAKKLGWDVTFLGATPVNVLEVPALGKEAVEGLYAAAAFEIPYEDTAKGKVKDWLTNYKKMFGTDANTQAIIGYNAIETFAFYANKAGGSDRPEDARRAGVRRQVPGYLNSPRPPSRRPTTSPAPSPRYNRSRTAAGC